VIVYGADEAVAKWVSLNLTGLDDSYEKYSAIGIVKDEQLIAGVVYSNYQPNILIEMHIFSIDKRWCNRHTLRKIFCYPFIQLNLERTQAICSADNEGVHVFLEKIGFTREGYHRKAYFDGSDAVSFGMLKSECKWLPASTEMLGG